MEIIDRITMQLRIQRIKIFWMIPISSKVEKYKRFIASKIKRNGKCSTIVIGIFAGEENAFLIQNAFPVKAVYLDHVHTIQGNPITVHKNWIKNFGQS